jgi:hypothetical protein
VFSILSLAMSGLVSRTWSLPCVFLRRCVVNNRCRAVHLLLLRFVDGGPTRSELPQQIGSGREPMPKSSEDVQIRA